MSQTFNSTIICWHTCQILPPEFGIVCTHPMFGPESGKHGWSKLPFIYDKVRLVEEGDQKAKCDRFLSIFEQEVTLDWPMRNFHLFALHVKHAMLTVACRDVGWWRCRARSMTATPRGASSSRTPLGGGQQIISISNSVLLPFACL